MRTSALVQNFLVTLYSKCIRKKQNNSEESDTQLKRCLNLFDLTSLGIAATLGTGIYVVAGQVAKDTAGPAVVLSFLIAAIACFLSGLCYAEFGARVPTAGSGYLYAYVSTGELLAFITGWNLILTYVIGASSVAITISAYIDSLTNNTISDFQRKNFPLFNFNNKSSEDIINSITMPYADLFAGFITLLMTLVLSGGVKEATWMNNLFTVINIVVIIFIVASGLSQSHISYWSINPAAVKQTDIGKGGFFPYGWWGVVSGAGTCFYAFIGFDSIATSGEEAKYPKRDIPLSTLLCLLISFLCYASVSMVLTLVEPYYSLTDMTPVLDIYTHLDWPVAKIIVAIGAFCSLIASIFGSIFPMPRIIYSMATDGLLFSFLGYVSKRFKSPIVATLVSGVFAFSMSTFFNLMTLLNFMSIGTLLAYSQVSLSVLLLRYKTTTKTQSEDYFAEEKEKVDIISESENIELSLEQSLNLAVEESLHRHKSYHSKYGSMINLLNENHTTKISPWKYVKEKLFPKNTIPNESTEQLALFYIVTCLLLLLVTAFVITSIDYASPLFSVLCPVLIIFILLLIILLWQQPQCKKQYYFMVPFVPLLPIVSVCINMILLVTFSLSTWLMYATWLFVGLVIYFTWGIRKSKVVEDPVQFLVLEPDDYDSGMPAD